MGIAGYLRIIGRGARGARALDRAQARDLMTQLLSGALTDLEVGAFALAMRIKGEADDELDGFFDAVQPHNRPVEATRPVLLLPSYNGARRLPNLTPLLACLLAREGTPVLVHGSADDPARVGSAAIFAALGQAPARDAADAARAWSRGEPAFLPIEALNPPLARLLDVRRVVGLRNPGHTLAKLIDPVRGAPALRVINTTHRAYAESLAGFVQRRRANALLLRGTEGEPHADPRRCPSMDVFLAGERRHDLSIPAQEGSLSELPALAAGLDAAATAQTVRAMLDGALPVPAPIARQAAALRAALGGCSGAASPL